MRPESLITIGRTSHARSYFLRPKKPGDVSSRSWCTILARPSHLYDVVSHHRVFYPDIVSSHFACGAQHANENMQCALLAIRPGDRTSPLRYGLFQMMPRF